MSANGLKEVLQDGILVLTVSHPPANALTPELCAALLRAISVPPSGCRGIVLTAVGPGFSTQLPLDSDAGGPELATLCRAVECCAVPVVAVLQGVVTGPGAELALAARARLAAPSLRLSFAEVGLGLCPAGGTTRRLPRLIGPEAALRVLLTGRVVPASEALSLGLVDGITDTGPLAPALRLAEALAVRDLLQRPTPDAAVWTAAVAAARRDPAPRTLAGRKIVDCVEAALLLPQDAAQAFETVARADLAATPQARGLLAAARAERLALTLPPLLTRQQPLSVDRVGLAGASPDLSRLAVAALSRGLAVVWATPDAAARDQGISAIRAAIDEGVQAGRLAPDRALAMRERVAVTTDAGLLASAPLSICDRVVAAPDSWRDLPGAARLVLGGADRLMGLALPPAGRVCEITLPDEVLPLARATAMSGLKRMGLMPILVGQRPILGVRMADAGKTALAWMVARGVPRRLIASALEGFGLRLADSVSMEVPEVARVMPVNEVLHRWLAALANEGARLLDEGIARRPSDIDHLMTSGFSFPRWQGGPMHQADRRGLMVLRRDLRAWAGEAALWTPAPLIDRLIRDGNDFAALDA